MSVHLGNDVSTGGVKRPPGDQPGRADVRYVQEQLGHAQLATTQIYTQVAIRTLKAVHTATHPGPTLERRPHGCSKSPSLAAEAAVHGVKA